MRKDKPPIPDFKGRGVSGFYRDVVSEMKHVTWPSRNETTRLTGTVLAVCAILAVALTALSWALEAALRVIGIGGR